MDSRKAFFRPVSCRASLNKQPSPRCRTQPREAVTGVIYEVAPQVTKESMGVRLAILRFFDSTVRVAHDSIKPGA
jgi:hypothetical protein